MLKSFIFLTILVLSFQDSLADDRNKRALDISSCLKQDWLTCGLTIGTAYFSARKWNDITTTTFLGHTCTGRAKGGFYRWKWVYQGTFTCPTLTGLVGTSSNFKSSRGAVEHAVVDFMQKIVKAKIISASDIKTLSALSG